MVRFVDGACWLRAIEPASTRRLRRTTGASSVVGERALGPREACVGMGWRGYIKTSLAALAHLRKLLVNLHFFHPARLAERAWGVWAVHHRSVLCKERASQGTLEISSRCQGTALPYFRRGVTCGEMEGYVWREGGAKGWR